jgi:hypothetical protein
MAWAASPKAHNQQHRSLYGVLVAEEVHADNQCIAL